MTQFLETYKPHLIYAAIVIAVFMVFRLLTNVLYKWLLKKKAQQIPNAPVKSVRIIKRILNILWTVLTIIALTFVFVDRDKDAMLVDYFKLVSYLGVVAVITIILATVCNIWFKQKIQDKIVQDYDPTSYKFLRYVAVFTICFIGLLFGLLAFPSLKGVAQTALGGAGVIALIAGVASQEALSNVVGGIFIISFKPFKIGDLVKVTDTMVGTVTDITLRHTVIRNFENKMIVIPNAIINKEKLINYDLGELKCCERIEIKISYDSDVDVAKRIMQEECEAHPLLLDNRTPLDKKDGKPIAKTALIEMNEYYVTVRVWAWANNFSDCFQLKIDVLETIKKRFKESNIEMPSPNRTIYIKNKNES